MAAEDRATRAEIAEHLRRNRELCHPLIEYRDQDVRGSQDVRELIVRLEREEQEVVETPFGPLVGEPLGAHPFADDHHLRIGQLLGHRGEELRRMLPADRPGIQEDESFRVETVLAGPGIVLRTQRKVVDHRPVADHRRRVGTGLEHGCDESVVDDDDGIGSADQRALQHPQATADDASGSSQRMLGEAGLDVLEPQDPPSPPQARGQWR